MKKFSIALHGGAGTLVKGAMTVKLEAKYKQHLEEALKVGYSILEKGGTALEAVEKTVVELENSPLFNAGR